MPFWSDEASQFKARELFASDAQLLGRVTYEGFAAAWPTMEGTGEFGEKMNSMPKYVASRTLDTATWNATIIKGDVADKVRELKQEDGGDLLIAGSGQLIDYLTAHDLIDEYRMMVVPDRARQRDQAPLQRRAAAHLHTRRVADPADGCRGQHLPSGRSGIGVAGSRSQPAEGRRRRAVGVRPTAALPRWRGRSCRR